MVEPNPHLLAIHRTSDAMSERTGYVRLDRNERVTPFSERTFRDMLDSLGPEVFCVYPDPTPLYRGLSRRLGLPESCLYLTPGSDAALRMIFQTYVRPRDAVVIPHPTYAMYGIYSQIFQATVDRIAYGHDMALDTHELLARLAKRPRVLALPNPNQPTGTVVSQAIIKELAKAARATGTLFLIDEAYYPFYPNTVINLVREFDNLVVTRTFSKVGGLAGLRLGYLAAHESIVKTVEKIRGAHEVNAVAIAIGSYVIDHPELEKQFLEEIESGRSVLASAARSLRLECPPCPTNFQLVRFPGLTTTEAIVTGLKAKGYLVKGSFTEPPIQNCIRVTLAEPEVMQGFVDALRQVLSEVREGVWIR